MEDDTGGEETSDYSSLSDELKNIQNHIKLTGNQSSNIQDNEIVNNEFDYCEACLNSKLKDYAIDTEFVAAVDMLLKNEITVL